ncbi:uncharacterized protein LOC142973309 [Anticarsia gemmatalis]|uniref:uncharacterized protein LOC142973309 n=1 Tax=Anticarsia gemmatalis TaxID=129554 RepID=UPI003F76FFF8
MDYKCILVLCLHITLVYSAPMKVQLLPLQYGMAQNSLMQLQNPFLRQALTNTQSPSIDYQPPIMVFLLNPGVADDRYIKLNEHSNVKSNTGVVDEERDSIILDADQSETDPKVMEVSAATRGIIGMIVSQIPFLPIHINVPDTISWIISQFPPISQWFRPGQTENAQRLSNKGPMPIFVVPAPMMQ